MWKDEAIELLRSLVRIPSVSAHAGQPYADCASLLVEALETIPGMHARVYEFVKGKPVVIGRLEPDHAGSSIPSIMLSGHYDVVPATDGWSSDPFGAEIKNNRIYGRGTQDMKSVLIQYICGLRLALEGGKKFKRRIHVVFLPDEEIGGRDGAQALIASDHLSAIGLILDEGLANTGNSFSVFSGERAINYVRISVHGPTGHGSRFIQNTAVEQIGEILKNVYEYRSHQEKECNCKALGDVLTVNVTSIHAPVQQNHFKDSTIAPHNVIPPNAEMVMDVRVPLHESDLEGLIKTKFLKNVRVEDVEIQFIQRTEHPAESLGQKRATELVKDALQSIMERMGNTTQIATEIFPAATDSRHFRKSGIPCIGFSPIRNTPVLLHDVNEFITIEGFLEGCEVYADLLVALDDKF